MIGPNLRFYISDLIHAISIKLRIDRPLITYGDTTMFSTIFRFFKFFSKRKSNDKRWGTLKKAWRKDELNERSNNLVRVRIFETIKINRARGQRGHGGHWTVRFQGISRCLHTVTSLLGEMSTHAGLLSLSLCLVHCI